MSNSGLESDDRSDCDEDEDEDDKRRSTMARILCPHVKSNSAMDEGLTAKQRLRKRQLLSLSKL